MRQLVLKLAEGGLRVLIWDRPNCGESDLSFQGKSESILNAGALAGLVRALEPEPALLIGGSAGSRVSLLTAIRDPGAAERLFLLWISGSAVGLATLAYHYCHDPLAAAAMGGMRAVAELPAFKVARTANPSLRARLKLGALALEPPQ